MPEHTLDEYGEHNPEACYECLLGEEVKNDCTCAECCKRLLIEVVPQDAEREPRIKELGSPILDAADENGHREVIGYLLNTSKEHMGCVFLDRATNRCQIYKTRPLTCRLFDCEGEGRELLIELGIIDREQD